MEMKATGAGRYGVDGHVAHVGGKVRVRLIGQFRSTACQLRARPDETLSPRSKQ
jgi:hypothetical protein